MNPPPLAAESCCVPHTQPLGPAAGLRRAWGQAHLPPQHLVPTHGVAGGHLRLPDAHDAVLKRSWRRGAVICRETGCSDISALTTALLHPLTLWISPHSM